MGKTAAKRTEFISGALIAIMFKASAITTTTIRLVLTVTGIKPIVWQDQSLILVDQRELPREVLYKKYQDAAGVYEAINKMVVRGAPAIGIAAAYGLYLGVKEHNEEDTKGFLRQVTKKAQYLSGARPTATNLFWALERMEKTALKHEKLPVKEIKERLLKEARAIHKEDGEINYRLGQHLLGLLHDGMGILTHCNAGQLATSKYGTATAPLYLAQERGWKLRIFADETRPRFQGASLTTFELMEAGMDVTLITDSMAAAVMSKGLADAVITGTDRVAANGDAANKIGTLGLSVLAAHYKIPFYIAAPTPTIDMSLDGGDKIPIEFRDTREITEIFGVKIAPDGCQAYNPAFDVTPAENITAIITEKGIARPPFTASLKEIMTAPC